MKSENLLVHSTGEDGGGRDTGSSLFLEFVVEILIGLVRVCLNWKSAVIIRGDTALC